MNDAAPLFKSYTLAVLNQQCSLSSPKIPAPFRHNSGAAGALILLTVP